MSAHYVSHHGQGYRVYRLVNGLYRAYTGPFFATPKEAARYADTLSQSADESTARSAAPLRVGVRLDSSADRREPVNRTHRSG